jgi:transcriptional regulator with XRE-family HTH domain
VSSPREHFAANLRHFRKGTGLSQEALADLAGLHRTTVGMYERRRRSPKLEAIVALAGALDLASPCELLEGITHCSAS